jgi:hypothetical protein
MVTFPSSIRTCLVLLASAIPFAFTGCAEKTTHAASPVNAAPANADTAHPMTVAPDTTAAPPQEATVPPPPVPPAVASANSAPPVTIATSKPPAPRRPAEQSGAASEPEAVAHPAAPQISPQLSAGDQASYQRKTTDDISTAEANLQRAGGRQLNAAQQDLVEKIRSFLGQSRDAGKGGDWVRAQNLSQKARLLSAELIASL